MVAEKEASRTVPPYVSYKTFDNFLTGLKPGVPSHVDKSVLRNLAGGVQTQLLNALRYLALIDERGRTQETLTRLVTSEGAERESVMAEVLQASYPFLFDDDFQLDKATAMQFYDRFRGTGATGETVRKCATFFVAAAKDAGMKVSPYIERPAPERNGQPKPARPRTPQAARKPARGQAGKGDAPSAPVIVEAPALSWEQMLLSKFPSFDPAWPDDVKSKWFDAFDRLMDSGQTRQAAQRTERPADDAPDEYDDADSDEE